MSIGLAVFLILFVVLLLVGAPTYLALLSSGLAYCFIDGGIANMMIMQKMFGSLDNFVLLAIPMFMMAGIIMNNGGITDRIFGFCRALLGHFPGGLAYVNVASSVIFSGMSGSALADVGGLGQVEMKAMREEGYDDDLTIGVTCASSTIGPIIPPSIPMVIYGSAASVSVGALFAAGAVPGLCLALIMCVAVFISAKKKHYEVHKRSSLKELWTAFRKSFFALCMPFLIMGGIWSGKFTPTEAALVSILYALFIILALYREMSPKRVVPVISETAQGIAPALTIVSSAALFGWVMQFVGLDQFLLRTMLSISTNTWVIMTMLNVLLIFFGMILDSTPVILLMVPVLLPLTRTIGINDVHLGVVVVLNLMIGLMTPPIGQSLFMLAGVTKKSFGEIVSHTWRWLIPLFLGLGVTTYCPDVVLFIPRILGLVN